MGALRARPGRASSGVVSVACGVGAAAPHQVTGAGELGSLRTVRAVRNGRGQCKSET